MSLPLVVLTDPNAGPAGDGPSPLHIVAAIGLISESAIWGVFGCEPSSRGVTLGLPVADHSAHLNEACLRVFLGDMTAFNPLAYCDFGTLEILDA